MPEQETGTWMKKGGNSFVSFCLVVVLNSDDEEPVTELSVWFNIEPLSQGPPHTAAPTAQHLF